MRRTISLLLGTGAIAVGVAACGGSSVTATPAASIGKVSSRLSISAPRSGALMFSTRTLKAKPGTVVITFTNRSSEGHNLTVARRGGKVIGATPTFSHGSRTLTLRVKAGRYTYYCSVPGHRQAGMQGTLIVS